MSRVASCFVSVVVPLYNDAALIDAFVEETAAVLEAAFEHYELVLVDDGSTDDTVARVRELLGRVVGLRLLRLSRNNGHDIALSAGLDGAIGDYVVTLLPSYDPPKQIPAMVELSMREDAVVYGTCRRVPGDSWAVALGRRLFQRLSTRMLDIPLQKDATVFHVFPRAALNAMLQLKDKVRYLRLFAPLVAPKIVPFPYQPEVRSRVRGRGFFASMGVATDIIVSNSVRPLRAVSALGLLGSFLNLLYIGYVFAIAIFKKEVAEGWVTLSLQNAGMFLLLFMILTVLSEYLGRVLAETKNRPLYHVLEELNSSVLLPPDERRNVVTESA